MNEKEYKNILNVLIKKEPKYKRNAYFLIQESIAFSVKHFEKTDFGKKRHLTPRELAEGIKIYTLQQFGPMSLTVLNEWGLYSTEDFGRLVFSMIKAKLLDSQKNDKEEDFANCYDFQEAFEIPFQPPKEEPEKLPVIE